MKEYVITHLHTMNSNSILADSPSKLEDYLKEIKNKDGIRGIIRTEHGHCQNWFKTYQLMEKYNWPGNVRELENIIERATLFEESPELTVASLPSIFRHAVSRTPRRNINSLDQMNRTHIEEVLESTGGNKTEASKILGINRSTLYRIMKRFKIQ